MEPTQLLGQLFDKKKMAVVRIFLSQPERELTMLEVARASRVSNATTFRILGKLVSLEIVEERKVKHLKTYCLAENEATKYLSRIMETGQSALEAFVEALKPLPGLREIILHGKQKREKANVLIIGQGVDASLVQEAVRQIQEQFNYTIVQLTLDPAQYEQMLSMGLYSGEKKGLYKAPEQF